MSSPEFYPTDSPFSLGNMPAEQVTLRVINQELQNATYFSTHTVLIPGKHALHDSTTDIQRYDDASGATPDTIADFRITGRGFDYAPDDILVIDSFSLLGGPLGLKLRRTGHVLLEGATIITPTETTRSSASSERTAREILRVLQSSQSI